jgi:hypothetical protein
MLVAKLIERSWPIFAALGVLLPGSAFAQDACALQCSARENAWCTGQEFYCAFNFKDCMKVCEGPASGPAPVRPVDPCYLAQNAMRPCSHDPQKPSVAVGVDRKLVGTWELTVPNPFGDSRWVWEIRQDGTYHFHAEGPGAVPEHSGTFAASKGDYTLNSTTMNYSDAGTYQLAANGTLMAKGRLGPGTWHRVQPKAAASSGNSK